MTTKDKVLSVMNSLDENASLDEVIDRLYLVRKIELGMAQADAGDVIDHDQFMAELEKEDGR
jgi:predicted transcriptional regulator